MEKIQGITNNVNSTEYNNSSHEDILGIHHVTAIASDPQKNIDFYTRVLGLRLGKLAVNSWLESVRNDLEKVLPPVRLPISEGRQQVLNKEQ